MLSVVNVVRRTLHIQAIQQTNKRCQKLAHLLYFARSRWVACLEVYVRDTGWERFVNTT